MLAIWPIGMGWGTQMSRGTISPMGGGGGAFNLEGKIGKKNLVQKKKFWGVVPYSHKLWKRVV